MDTTTTNVCGKQTYTYGECSSDCGPGLQQQTACFSFFDGTKNGADQCKETDVTRTCTALCPFGPCVCNSNDVNSLTAQKTNATTNKVTDCTAEEAVDACGAWDDVTVSECAADDDSTCGPGTKQESKCFVFKNEERQCIDTDIDCDHGKCWGDCVCSSDNPAALTAQRCNLNDGEDCEACADTSICGSVLDDVTSDCSTTSGEGVVTITKCFE